MNGRRRSFLLLAAMLIGIAGVLAYLALATGQPIVDKPLSIAGSLIVGPIGVVIAVRCLRWRNQGDIEAANNPAAVVHMTTARFEVYTVALALLAMAAGFAFAIGAPDIKLQVLAWVGMVGFAVLSVMILVTRRIAWLRLSPDGLEFSAFGVGPIPWKDIRGARSTSALGRVPIVALDLNNEEDYQARRRGLRLRFLERLLLSSSFTIAPPSMDMSCDMLVKAIEIRIAAFGRGSQPA
jgi:Na+/melibiose symporter-like transporter